LRAAAGADDNCVQDRALTGEGAVKDLHWAGADGRASWRGHTQKSPPIDDGATGVGIISQEVKTSAALIAGAAPNNYGVLYNTTATSVDPSYLIRLAELYLIRAEARAQQNNLSNINGALADLNVIRSRSGVPVSTAITQADILQAIEDENSIEFAFEAHRWFDLVRTGRAGAVLGLTNQNYWLFPLPLSDVLSDPDLDGKNNPGY